MAQGMVNTIYLAIRRFKHGEMAEWLNAPVLKTGVLERVSGVRIPLSPPISTGPECVSNPRIDLTQIPNPRVERKNPNPRVERKKSFQKIFS